MLCCHCWVMQGEHLAILEAARSRGAREPQPVCSALTILAELSLDTGCQLDVV